MESNRTSLLKEGALTLLPLKCFPAACFLKISHRSHKEVETGCKILLSFVLLEASGAVMVLPLLGGKGP